MKKLTAKKKYRYLQLFGIFLVLFVLLGTTTLYVLLKIDELWAPIAEGKITNFLQWFTLIIYRIVIYLLPALILTIFRFDKRYKTSSRFVIWLNWTMFIYLITKAFIEVFAIDLLLGTSLFNIVDSFVLLLGYIFTLIKKRKIEFDSSGAIIGEKP